MKKKILIFLMVLPIFILAQLPKPDHIVVVMFQNKNYSEIVGSSNAPYINLLLADSSTAQFTQSYALAHPSQPNYLMLFSGTNQGVTTDNVPANTPFHTCNLGASLLASAHTFTGYSESMPSAGYLGINTSLYYRKHNPWSDWQGTGSNTLPASVNQPFSSFPADFSQLPTVSIVVPNIINCMHDGTIQQGDTWLQSHISAYAQWAKTHNSLLIVTFDEDNFNAENNHILTLFNGPMVKHGQYGNRITHYELLRTIEDMYGLSACGASSGVKAIDNVWKSGTVGINENKNIINSVTVVSNPDDEMVVTINSTSPVTELIISLVDLLGKSSQQKKVNIEAGENQVNFNTSGLTPGVYFISVAGKDIKYAKKVIIN